MKRERIPVMAEHANGNRIVLGHISRVTSSALAAFLRREGFVVLEAYGVTARSWDRVHGRAAFQSDGWTVAVEREMGTEMGSTRPANPSR